MTIATLPLTADAAGVRFRVRAVPGARREGLVGRYGDALRVAVRPVAEDGRANRALIEELAALFAVPRAAVQIVSGAGARDKLVAIAGLSAAEARARLEALAAPIEAAPPSSRAGSDG
jgi:uncharacterized protein